MKTIGVYPSLVEARNVIGFLESRGISAFLLEEHSSNTLPHFLPVQGLHVRVADFDFFKAQKLLEEVNKQQNESSGD